MDDVAQEFSLWGDVVLCGIGEGNFWADEDLAEAVVLVVCFGGIVDGEGDAVGGGWIIEKLFVQGGDGALTDEVNDDLVCSDVELG